MLRKAFDSFDTEKKGCIGTDMVAPILEMFGQKVSGNALKQVIAEADADGERGVTGSVAVSVEAKC